MLTKEKSMIFDIPEMEAINFCRILGKYGVRFEISELQSIPREDDKAKRIYYRVFTVRAPRKQLDQVCYDLNTN